MRISTALASGRDEGNRSVARRTDVGAAAVLALGGLLVGCSAQKGVQDPANELPLGHIESPLEGAEVKMLAPIAGWALDDRGIREIRLYIDGHIVNSGRPAADRPDLSRSFPQYAQHGDRHGWTLLMGFDVPGPHTVLVQAIDTDGASRDIGVLHVTAIDK